MSQPWPFEDAENTAVFTTRQVLEGEAPILLVTHDKVDGAWQFHPLEMPRVEDARVIALCEAVELDPSVCELATLQPGWVAVRGSVGGPWKSRPKGLACRVVEYGFGEPMIVTIDQEPPDSADAVQLLEELDVDLHQHAYPPESRHALSVEQLVREGVAFFVARYEGDPAGCGGVQLFGREYGEVKRMYVRPARRGIGLGKFILDCLAEHCQEQNVNQLRLETGIHQADAIALYERAGFRRRPPFGNYRDDAMSLYFELSLDPALPEGK